METSEIKLFLSEEVTHSSTYSNYAIASYCVLKALTTTTTITRHCLSPTQIGFYLVNDVQQSKRFFNYVKCGIDELVENNVIKKDSEYMKNYILDCSNLWIDAEKSKFTIVTFEEIQTIFTVKNVNNFLLLRYFIYLIGTVSSSIDVWIDAVQHKTRVVGNLTIDYLANISGISERSIIDYNKILEDIGLIYINRQNDFLIDDTGEITQLPNVYGRQNDKIYIDQFANSQKKFKKSYKYVNKNIHKANNKRRLAQMYNQLCSGNGEKYTHEDIIEIYKYVISQNTKYEKLYQKNNYEDYLEKIRDMAIFEKYEFIPKRRTMNEKSEM